MAGAPAWIRKEHLSNMSLRSYRNTNALEYIYVLCIIIMIILLNSINLLAFLPLPPRQELIFLILSR